MDERAMPGAANWPTLAGPHLARYLFAVPLAAGRRVLDAGCGCGYGAALLRDGGATEVVAVDRDPRSVDFSHAHYARDGIQFLCDDCEQLNTVQGQFDLIVSFENLEHLERPRRFLGEAGRRMSNGGLLLVSTPDRAASPPAKNGHPRNPYHFQEWNADELRETLRQYFAEIDLRTQVVGFAVERRRRAVAAIRKGLLWLNPLATLLWRKLPLVYARESWKQLDGLSEGGPADYPIVPPSLADLFGRPAFHVALCRRPRVMDHGSCLLNS